MCILELSGSQDVNFPMKEEVEEVNSYVVCALCEASVNASLHVDIIHGLHVTCRY